MNMADQSALRIFAGREALLVEETMHGDQAERQALYHLANEVRFELERRHFHPELPAFIPYMLAPTKKGPTPVWQMIKDAQTLALPEPVESEVVFEGD